MFCTKCGKEIIGTQFCQQCGEKPPVKKIKFLRTLWVLVFVLVAVTIYIYHDDFAGFVSGFVAGFTSNSGTSAANSSPPVANSGPSVPPQQKPAVTNQPLSWPSGTWELPADPKNCHESLIFNNSHVTSQTRQEYATKLQIGQSGTFDVIFSTGGEDDEYLLVAANPSNGQEMATFRQAAAGWISEQDFRVTLCLQGFAEVQFMTRDTDGNQRLIQRYVTDPKGTTQYLSQRHLLQRGEATPIR